jgi:hypothetical protein
VESAGGKAYGIATGLYNKHRKYSEQWNPWHPLQSAHDFQQAQSFSQQTKMWIPQHLTHGLENINIETFQSTEARPKLFSGIGLVIRNDSGIGIYSPIFGILSYWDILRGIQFLLAHLPYEEHLDCELVCLAEFWGCRPFSEMCASNWLRETQDPLSASATIVLVICVSEKTHFTNLSGDWPGWPRFLTIGWQYWKCYLQYTYNACLD